MAVDEVVQWVALPHGTSDDGALLRVSVFVAPRLNATATVEGEQPTLRWFPDFLDWPRRVADARFELETGGGSFEFTVASPPPDLGLWQRLFPPGTPVTPYAFDDHAARPVVTYSARPLVDFIRSSYVQAAASTDDLPRIDGDPGRGLSDVFAPAVELHDCPDREPAGTGGSGRTSGSGIAFTVAGGSVDGVGGGSVDAEPTPLPPMLERLACAADAKAYDRVIADMLIRARARAASVTAAAWPTVGTMIEPFEPADGEPTAAEHLAKAMVFHRRPSEPVELPATEDATAAAYRAEFDFHQMVSALGSHPWLLRKLGLVIDLTVPAYPMLDELGIDGETESLDFEVRVAWTSTLPPEGTLSNLWPRTRAVVTSAHTATTTTAATSFRALRSGGPAGALLPLPEETFSVEQLDIDGAVMKLSGFGASLAAHARDSGRDGGPVLPERTAPPALRTGGLALVHSGRGRALFSEFARSRELSVASSHELYAEDLTRGYRLDVWDRDAGRWFSLHEREVTYRVGDDDLPPVEDEGFLEVSVSGEATPPGSDIDPHGAVYVHEALATWDGWSLSAPRPGKVISRDPRAPDPDVPETQPQQPDNTPLTAMDLSIRARARARSLPRLRFGRDYRFRVRPVDLAGNSATLAGADQETETGGGAFGLPANPQTYLRFEPVAAPTLVPHRPYAEGESLHRLVIRSDRDLTTAQWSAAHPPYRPADERHVLPPKASQQLVERHGMLDAAFAPDATGAERRMAYEIARRESGSLDTTPGAQRIPIPHADGSVAEPNHYVVYGAEQLAVPYLPDPLASGVVFLGLPGVRDGDVYQLDFGGGHWDRPGPIRLRLNEPEGTSTAPRWDEAARTLDVFLPKGTTRTVRIASKLGDPELMALLRWCREQADPQAETIEAAAKASRHWMFTPWHEVTLVHAVQRPLYEPSIGQLAVGEYRPAGATDADLDGCVAVHPSSTHQVELLATWKETVDDLAEDGPREVAGSAQVLTVPLAAADGSAEVEARLTAEKLLWFDTAGGDGVPTLAPQEFGDTRHRRVVYQARATSAFREYFPAADAETPGTLSRLGAPLGVDVPSSSPPPAPQVVAVVPTFGWPLAGGGRPAGSVTRERRGGGVRVYLARPWFASGDGELLGVVLGDPLGDVASYPYVSHLGTDPTRDGAPVPLLEPGSFRGATLTAQVVLPEIYAQTQNRQGSRVTIVGYAPAYDPDTKRWFCDVELDTRDAYFPFLRLALVRYQPHAISGGPGESPDKFTVSPVVLTDLVQTVPDRLLTVTRQPGESIRVTLDGPAYTGLRDETGVRHDAPALARVTARLERRNPDMKDPLQAWQPLDGAEAELAPTRDDTARAATLPMPDDVTDTRLLVVEEERFPVDAGIVGVSGFTGRVVYADTLDLAQLDRDALLALADQWLAKARSHHPGQPDLRDEAATRALELYLQLSEEDWPDSQLQGIAERLRQLVGLLPAALPEDLAVKAAMKARELFARALARAPGDRQFWIAVTWLGEASVLKATGDDRHRRAATEAYPLYEELADGPATTDAERDRLAGVAWHLRQLIGLLPAARVVEAAEKSRATWARLPHDYRYENQPTAYYTAVTWLDQAIALKETDAGRSRAAATVAYPRYARLADGPAATDEDVNLLAVVAYHLRHLVGLLPPDHPDDLVFKAGAKSRATWARLPHDYRYQNQPTASHIAVTGLGEAAVLKAAGDDRYQAVAAESLAALVPLVDEWLALVDAEPSRRGSLTTWANWLVQLGGLLDPTLAGQATAKAAEIRTRLGISHG